MANPNLSGCSRSGKTYAVCDLPLVRDKDCPIELYQGDLESDLDPSDIRCGDAFDVIVTRPVTPEISLPKWSVPPPSHQ